MYHLSPFRVTDLCVNSILLRANRDLRWLALKLGRKDVAAEVEGWLDAGFKGFNALWDEKEGVFKCQNQLTGELCNARTSAAFLPLFAGHKAGWEGVGRNLIVHSSLRFISVFFSQSVHSCVMLSRPLIISLHRGAEVVLKWANW